MSRVTLITGGESRIVDAPAGKTLAEIGALNDVPLFGSCHGTNTCCQCSRQIVEGLAHLFKRDGQPYKLPENAAPYVRHAK